DGPRADAGERRPGWKATLPPVSGGGAGWYIPARPDGQLSHAGPPAPGTRYDAATGLTSRDTPPESRRPPSLHSGPLRAPGAIRRRIRRPAYLARLRPPQPSP